MMKTKRMHGDAVLAAGFLLVLAGCRSPVRAARPMLVVSEIEDRTNGFGLPVPGHRFDGAISVQVTHGLACPGTCDHCLEVCPTPGLALFRLEDGSEVPGRQVAGVVKTDGTVLLPPDMWSQGWSFLPNAPLDDGWYVLVTDVRRYLPYGEFRNDYRVPCLDLIPSSFAVLLSASGSRGSNRWPSTAPRLDS